MRLLGNQFVPVRGTSPCDQVDDALRAAARREFFTPAEALELLHRVRESVAGGTLGATVAGIVADAAASYSNQMMLDRGRLVDPLLDIRLVLGDSRGGDRWHW
jgi:hypothetical protein